MLAGSPRATGMPLTPRGRRCRPLLSDVRPGPYRTWEGSMTSTTGEFLRLMRITRPVAARTSDPGERDRVQALLEEFEARSRSGQLSLAEWAGLMATLLRPSRGGTARRRVDIGTAGPGGPVGKPRCRTEARSEAKAARPSPSNGLGPMRPGGESDCRL